jgi:nitric oxide dioxygenase
MKVIGMTLEGLDRPGQLLPAARGMGARCAAAGVRDKDYETLRQALLWALRRVLGVEFTPEVRAAWKEASATLAGALRCGAAHGWPGPGAGALYL